MDAGSIPTPASTPTYQPLSGAFFFPEKTGIYQNILPQRIMDKFHAFLRRLALMDNFHAQSLNCLGSVDIIVRR